MNELVVMKDKQAVTSSLQVAETFGKRPDNVLRDIKALKKDVLNFEEMFQEAKVPDSYGRERKAYVMNRDGFTILTMGFTGKKALGFKLKYIQAFNEMEKQIQLNSSSVIDLLSDPDNAIKLLTEYSNNKKQLEIMKPKAQFSDAVTTSKTTILVGQLAKLISQNGVEIGANRLFGWLRENKYLSSRKGADWNTPTQMAMNKKLFEIKETVIDHPDGHTTINKTTKVTGTGQVYFINLFINKKD